MKRKCPTCARLFEPSEASKPFRPFCSGRCRAADLGKWLDGGYRIASPMSDDGVESEREPDAPDSPKLPH